MSPPMSEARFQADIIDLFTRTGWKHHHAHDSRRSVPGLPDLLLVHRKHGIVFAELKTDRGRTTPEQDAWIEALNVASRAQGGGTCAVVWRPASWDKIVDIAQHGLRTVRAS